MLLIYAVTCNHGRRGNGRFWGGSSKPEHSRSMPLWHRAQLFKQLIAPQSTPWHVLSLRRYGQTTNDVDSCLAVLLKREREGEGVRGRGSEGRRRWKRLLFGNFVVQIYVYWQRGEEKTVKVLHM